MSTDVPTPFDTPNTQSGQLNQLTDAFEEAWLACPRPDLEEYLPNGDDRGATLVALVHLDLEYRIRAGDDVGLEEYLCLYPELRNDRDAFIGLIEAEFALRQRFPRRPNWQDFFHRFAELGPELAARLQGSEPPSPAEMVVARRRLGKFELLEPVGDGSFGTVYKARDPDTNRLVAVKVLRPGRLPDVETRKRFQREAHSVGGLRHTGIVTLHEAGIDESICYFVTEWLPGGDLRQLLARNRPPIRRSAELVATVAEALDHAHRHGVIHRDVKPSNILLDAQGQPHLTDFGLARLVEVEGSLTAKGEIVGTPAYMAPEQARGDSPRVDGRSDVYSLGVVLYELLTGELPFRGSTPMVLRQVLEEDPRPPRQFDQTIPVDLETVCLKAMAKEPAARYASGGEFACDLRLYLKGGAVLARPLGPIARLWHRCRRKPLLASLIAALVVVTLGGFALVSWQWWRAEHQRHLAEIRLTEVEQQRQESETHFQCALEAVNRLTWTLTCNSEIVKTPALRRLRKENLERNVVLYRRLHHQRPDDAGLQLAMGRALVSLGHIHRDEPDGEKLAGPFYEEGTRLFADLVACDPRNPVYQCELSVAQSNLAHIRWNEGRNESIALLRRAADGYARMLHNGAELNELSLIHCCEVCATLYDKWNKSERRSESIALLPLMHTAFRKLEQRHSHNKQLATPNPSGTTSLIHALHCIGRAERESRNFSAALRTHQRQHELAGRLVRKAPTDLRYRHLLAESLYYLARANYDMDKLSEALHYFQEFVTLQEQRIQQYPKEVEPRFRLAIGCNCIGNIHSDAKRPTEATRFYRKAADVFEELCRTQQDNYTFHHPAANIWRNLGQELQLLGSSQEAIDAFEHQRMHLNAVLKKMPQSRQHQRELEKCLQRLTRIHQASKHKKKPVN